MLSSSPVPLYVIVSIAVGLCYFLYVMAAVEKQKRAARLFQQKNYAEAAGSYQSLLRWPLPSGIEADTRRRLADTLDVLGRTEEAAQERERARAAAQKGTLDPAALETQGDLLKLKHQYDDACQMYHRALNLLPALAGTGRAHMMAKLALTHGEAGRPEEALKWAKMSLGGKPSKDIQRAMESIAGVACADQGNLEEAQQHYSRALELAEANGKPEDTAQSLAMLADIQHKRGHLEEAISNARRAVKTCDSPFRGGRIVEVECLRDLGRFEEARAVATQMKQGPRHDQPAIEQRMQAMCALTLAWTETAADRPAAALTALEEVREHLKVASQSTVWPPPPTSGEDKLAVLCDSTLMRVHAQLGHQEEARRLRASLETRLPRYAADRAVLMQSYGQFARAAFYLGDPAESRDFWQRCLGYRPNPSGLPPIYYWLGETHLRLGETDMARDFFRQAVAPGIDSLDARRAQARLNELGG